MMSVPGAVMTLLTVSRSFLVCLAIICSVFCGRMIEADYPHAKQAGPGSSIASAYEPAASRWEGQLLKRPGHSLEDDKIYLVEGGYKRWVVSLDWLWLHGYKSTDVRSVNAEDLAAIPLGAVIR
jgi:hypothetical protein